MRTKEKIEIGDKVMVALNGEIKELEIVDFSEGDPKSGKISFLSPIAQAILGHKYPERVKVKLPNGKAIECQLLRSIL